MKVLGERYIVPSEYFFSSTTYKTECFDRCVYCHSNVENDYFKYNGEFVGMPYRCNCEEALKELKLKEEFYVDMHRLHSSLDVDRINNITKYAIIEVIEQAFEDGNDINIRNILD